MQFFKDAVDLLFAILDLPVFDEGEFLEFKQRFQYNSNLALNYLSQSRLVVHHESHYFDESTE